MDFAHGITCSQTLFRAALRLCRELARCGLTMAIPSGFTLALISAIMGYGSAPENHLRGNALVRSAMVVKAVVSGVRW